MINRNKCSKKNYIYLQRMNVEKFTRIAQGWKNTIFLSPTIEAIAAGRSKICSECPHAVEHKWLKRIGKKFKRMMDIYCEKCGCPVSAKTRSVKETCPLIPAKW